MQIVIPDKNQDHLRSMQRIRIAHRLSKQRRRVAPELLQACAPLLELSWCCLQLPIPILFALCSHWQPDCDRFSAQRLAPLRMLLSHALLAH